MAKLRRFGSFSYLLRGAAWQDTTLFLIVYCANGVMVSFAGRLCGHIHVSQTQAAVRHTTLLVLAATFCDLHAIPLYDSLLDTAVVEIPRTVP